MKKFICCLLSVLLFTMPVYAGEIKGVEKIGGIEKIGDIPTGSITAIEKTDLEYDPSIHNVKSGLDEEYTFYSQLSDEGKQYYDDLEDNVMKMVNGTETVTTNITVNVGTGLDENTAINNASNIGFDGAKRGIVAFWYDNSQYFWFDINKIIFSASYYPNLSYNSEKGTFLLIIKTGVNNSGTGYTNYYPDGYDTQEEVETDWNKLVKCKNELIANMDNTGSDFEKVKYFNDWLCDNNTYNETTLVTKMRYIITGAMIYGDTDEKEKYPVCQSYAFALKYLCDEANIPCTVVTSSTHMWNLVKLNGKWYIVDTTWNDNYKDAYISANVKDKNLTCYNWLAIGSDKATAIDQDSAHIESIEYDFNAIDPTTNTLLENLGIDSYANADTNSDCTISRADIAVILKNANGKYKVTKDVNGDGKIDLKDSISLSKLLLK